jgi:RecA-family ATPase
VVVTKKEYDTFPPEGYDSNRPDRDRFRLRRMADVETRRVEWLWRNRIPFGKITNVEGDPENGKSLLTLTLAALASNGKPFPDGDDCPPCGVLLICDEDDYEDTIVPRLVAAGADTDVIYSLHPVKDDEGNLIPFFMPDDLPDLERNINDVKEATGRDEVVVIIDPVSACLNERINSGVDASVRRALSPLAELARNTSAAVLLVRHLNKNSSERNVKYRGGGSIGFFAAARAVLVVGRDPRDNDLVVLAQGKKNLSMAMPSLGYRI